MITHWPNGVDVLFNPKNDRLPAGQMEETIKYACWSIRERTGIDIRYASQTSEYRVVGKITVFIALPEDYDDYGATYSFYNRGFASRAHQPNEPYESVVVGIGRHWHVGDMNRRNKCTVVHELLHACGADHIDHESAVMRASFNEMMPGSYGLTCADFMPLQRGGNHTFVELTMENDLFIPCVSGKIVDLEYVGDGLVHKWKLRRLSDAGQPQVESAVEPVNLQKPDLIFTDVRSPTMRLSRAELEYDLHTEVWTLKSATVLQ